MLHLKHLKRQIGLDVAFLHATFGTTISFFAFPIWKKQRKLHLHLLGHKETSTPFLQLLCLIDKPWTVKPRKYSPYPSVYEEDICLPLEWRIRTTTHVVPIMWNMKRSVITEQNFFCYSKPGRYIVPQCHESVAGWTESARNDFYDKQSQEKSIQRVTLGVHRNEIVALRILLWDYLLCT